MKTYELVFVDVKTNQVQITLDEFRELIKEVESKAYNMGFEDGRKSKEHINSKPNNPYDQGLKKTTPD